MTDSTRDLLEKAKKLTLKERAELARELLASMDGEESVDAVAAAWRDEIERRAREALDPGTPAEDWPVVRKRLIEPFEKS